MDSVREGTLAHLERVHDCCLACVLTSAHVVCNICHRSTIIEALAARYVLSQMSSNAVMAKTVQKKTKTKTNLQGIGHHPRHPAAQFWGCMHVHSLGIVDKQQLIRVWPGRTAMQTSCSEQAAFQHRMAEQRVLPYVTPLAD